MHLTEVIRRLLATEYVGFELIRSIWLCRTVTACTSMSNELVSSSVDLSLMEITAMTGSDPPPKNSRSITHDASSTTATRHRLASRSEDRLHGSRETISHILHNKSPVVLMSMKPVDVVIRHRHLSCQLSAPLFSRTASYFQAYLIPVIQRHFIAMDGHVLRFLTVIPTWKQ